MEENKGLVQRTYFQEIFDKMYEGAIEEIEADYKRREKEVKNRSNYADFLNISESALKKLLGKKKENKSVFSIITILSLCDSLNIPIKFNYEIGLHTGQYENKGTESERRNINSDRYKRKLIPAEEIIRKYKDHGPTFTTYEPKVVTIGVPLLNGETDWHTIDCDKDDDELVKAALEYEKAINEMISYGKEHGFMYDSIDDFLNKNDNKDN